MSQPTAPRFDGHAADYEAELMRGVALSGESKEFFARGRIAHLCAWWRRSGRPPPQRILDYGCGIGDVSALLAEVFPEARVLGVDPSGECLALARERHASERVAFDGIDSPAARDAAAELVHVNGVVHHVAPADRPQLFASLRGSLAPGGVLALFENNPFNPGTRWVMARIPFDRDAVPVGPREARRRLREAGLAPRETRYLFFFPRFLAALRPLERALARVPLGAQYGVIAGRDDETASRARV